MEEIAQQFKEEYTELLSRYKDRLTNPQIMSVLQSVTKKQIGFKDNPERFERIFNNAIHNLAEEHIQQIVNSGPSLLEQHAIKEKFIAHPPVTNKWSSEHNTLQGEHKCTD